MFVSILLSEQGDHMLFKLRKNGALFALGLIAGSGCYSSVAWANSEASHLILKSTVRLSSSKALNSLSPLPVTLKTRSVLANLELFRGVDVDIDPPTHASIQNRDNRNARKSEENGSMIKAVFGGLQIALKENLSLVYSPGRMSRQVFDSDSQGLYLLTDRRGQVNWYVGIESDSSGRSSEVRRTTNSAQFGVILSLD